MVSDGNKVLMSVFDGSIFGPFSPERNGGIGFSIDNNLEMKVRSKTDSVEEEMKKVKIINLANTTAIRTILFQAVSIM